MTRTRTRKILFVSVHPPGRVPSQRFRFEQYVDFLGEHGFETTFSPIVHPGEHELLYSPGRHAAKAALIARGVGQRLIDVARASRYDIVFLHREAVQLGTTIFESAFQHSRPRLVFDFDDAIWLANSSPANRRFAWLKRPGKTGQIIAKADMVFAGNPYLYDYARRFNARVKLVPTTIDTERYVNPSPAHDRPEVCIGWSGSLTTIQHFKYAVPALRRIRDRFGSRVYFKVIGDGSFRHDELGIRGRDWDPATEIEDLSEFDIGVMPLPDDEWARGKCGLKGLQYMALGIPTVMSPVGVNTEIIDDGRDGFLAATEDEWVAKLSRLVESAELRARLGRAARETVVARYSVESQKDRYLEYLGELVEGIAPIGTRKAA